jgi:hypothetical protein
MVLIGSRHVNEEDDSGHSHSDPDYPMNEGEEGGEGDDNEVDSGKASLTPLWRYVTKQSAPRSEHHKLRLVYIHKQIMKSII